MRCKPVCIHRLWEHMDVDPHLKIQHGAQKFMMSLKICQHVNIEAIIHARVRDG